MTATGETVDKRRANEIPKILASKEAIRDLLACLSTDERVGVLHEVLKKFQSDCKSINRTEGY